MFVTHSKLQEEDMPEVWWMVREQQMTHEQAAKHFKMTTHTTARRLKGYETSPPKRSTKKAAKMRAAIN